MKKQGSCLYNQTLKSVFYIIFCTLFSVQTVAAEDWITEEVLKQLSEVRQELKVLKDGKLVGARLITGARPFQSFSSALDSLL